jgi:hypothetical protein
VKLVEIDALTIYIHATLVMPNIESLAEGVVVTLKLERSKRGRRRQYTSWFLRLTDELAAG